MTAIRSHQRRAYVLTVPCTSRDPGPARWVHDDRIEAPPGPFAGGPPSKGIDESVSRLRTEGIEGGGSVVRELLRPGAERVVQKLLERAAGAFLGRDPYERRADGEDLRGYRNGYRPRAVSTAEGQVEMQMPVLTRRSTPSTRGRRPSSRETADALERVVTGMYARGLSTHDIEDVLGDATGGGFLPMATRARSPVPYGPTSWPCAIGI